MRARLNSPDTRRIPGEIVIGLSWCGEYAPPMPMDFLVKARKWLAIVPIAAIVISVAVWLTTRDTLPRKIRLATAKENGLYHAFGEALRASLERRTGRPVEIIETKGSVENLTLALAGEADVAIIQGGSVSLDGLAMVAPLYPEVVHAIGRRGSQTDEIGDLKSKRVVLGPEGSGMRASAERVLEQYGMTHAIVDQSDAYFTSLLDDGGPDGAIVTTGFMNSDLQDVLSTGEFVLLPIDGAEAIATKEPYFHSMEIPRGLYREGPPVPGVSTPTVATTALLVVREGETELLIDVLLEAIYDEGLGLVFPTLISRENAIAMSPVPLHPASRGFFNPPDHIGRVAQVMDSLAAFKELSVAFAAGIYLLWTRWRRLKEEERAEIVQTQKDRLDVYLEKTLEIERAQVKSEDIVELQAFLDRVTEIKLDALSQLTHEELRSDQSFSIFILQCANLISKIQLKIINRTFKS